MLAIESLSSVISSIIVRRLGLELDGEEAKGGEGREC